MIHVLPVDDAIEHEDVGTCCPCGVSVDWSLPEAVVMHRAVDGRPQTEEIVSSACLAEQHEECGGDLGSGICECGCHD